jgi:hypothetical protein
MNDRYRVRRGLIAGACALAIGLSACGSDDTKSSEKPTSTTSTAKVSAEFQEYCDAAAKQAKQDGFPTAEQLQTLIDNAPSAIAEPANVAGTALLAVAESDPVAQFNAFAADDVEAAIAEINAWETENCKIPHDDGDQGAGEGATREIDPAATRVDVAMSEYAFTFDEPVTAGPTSFVTTSTGAQAHFMQVVKLADGVTLDEALQSDDDSKITGSWSTALAAAGGADEEVLTLDLKPGTYGMVCFIPDPDGTPHAMQGMAKQFAVS